MKPLSDDTWVLINDLTKKPGLFASDHKHEQWQNNALAALDAANAGNRNDAINKLEAFINSVEAQRGKELTDEQAELLGSYARYIVEALNGGVAAPAKQRRIGPQSKLSNIWGKLKAK